MIEGNVNRALGEVAQIERLLRQVGDHQDVSAVETGNVLALLLEWRQSLEVIRQVSRGINLRDIELTEEFLDRIGEECPSIRTILEQQKALAALQTIETSAIQAQLEGTGVSFDVPAPLLIGKWSTDRGYVVYVWDQGSRTLFPRKELRYHDTSIGIFEHRQLLVNYPQEERYGFLGLHSRLVTEQRQETDVRRICTLDMKQNPWRMGIWGKEAVPDALCLARSFRVLMKDRITIQTMLLSEKNRTRHVGGWVFHDDYTTGQFHEFAT